MERAGTTGSCLGHNGCKDLATNFCEPVRYPSPDLLTSTLAATPKWRRGRWGPGHFPDTFDRGPFLFKWSLKGSTIIEPVS